MPISDLGIVSFELPSKQTVEVSLYSIDGVKVRSVYRQQLAAGLQKAAILKGDLPAGIYLLNVDGENVKASHRIVIL
jgi:hypothetical protein